MILYQQISTLRKQQGLTQEELAEKAQVTVRTIQRLERGESTPRGYTLKAIAAALGTSPDAFSSDTTPTPPRPALTPPAEATHFLTMLCLSCFTYLVIPFVHFLVPIFLLRKNESLSASERAFAQKIIRRQVYWVVALHGTMLLTMAYNAWVVTYNKSFLIHYLMVVAVLGMLNAILLLRTLAFIHSPARRVLKMS